MKFTGYVGTESDSIVKDLGLFARTFLLAGVTGAFVGAYASVFGLLVGFANTFRKSHQWLMFLLPFGGLVIVALYRGLKSESSMGTNSVLYSISKAEKLKVTMAPLITVATFITHLLGGSAGREGAALQIGGCLGFNFGRLLKLNRKSLTLLTMCGMSAAFSALFGTPVAATIFAMEVVTVGTMHYSAILPCAMASVIGFEVSKLIGTEYEAFSEIVQIAPFDWLMCLRVCGLGIIMAAGSVLFCLALHGSERFFQKYIPNQYLRIFTGGVMIIFATIIVGSGDYQGAGGDVIARAIGGEAVWYAFALKIIFTAITIGAGFKGGEIVPTIFIGATLGCAVGPLLGIPASMAAALGVCGLFCGVTNCPLAALALSFELFGFNGVAYFLIMMAVSFRLSGYYSLYSAQEIVYSKSTPMRIDKTLK